MHFSTSNRFLLVNMKKFFQIIFTCNSLVNEEEELPIKSAVLFSFFKNNKQMSKLLSYGRAYWHVAWHCTARFYATLKTKETAPMSDTILHSAVRDYLFTNTWFIHGFLMQEMHPSKCSLLLIWRLRGYTIANSFTYNTS